MPVALARRRPLRRRRHRSARGRGARDAPRRPAARPRSGSGRRIPPARSARASPPRIAPGRRSPTSSSCSSTRRRSSTRRSSSRRRSAARARSSSTRRASRFTDELAPRDVVAREIAARGTVLLDLRAIDRGRFPSLMGSLVERGLRPGADADPGRSRRALHGRRRSSPTSTGAARCRASTRRASARRRACTARTGSRRTRCSSASSSGAAPRSPRSASPAFRHAASRTCRAAPTPEPVTPELRAALWRDCGLIRDAAGLGHLLDAPHLLTRLIAETALAREESRGSHFRADFPSESEELRAPRRPPTRRTSPRSRHGCSDRHARARRPRGARRGRRRGRRHDRGDRRRRRRRHGRDLLVKEPGVVCGLARSRRRSARSTPTFDSRRSRDDGDAVERACGRRPRHGLRSARSSPASASR